MRMHGPDATRKKSIKLWSFVKDTDNSFHPAKQKENVRQGALNLQKSMDTRT